MIQILYFKELLQNKLKQCLIWLSVHGVVCSPLELQLVNKRKSLLSITPGIRIKETNDDQKRVMTPTEAIELGADYLVIGRPITDSGNIQKSLNEIYESIK